MAYRGKIHYSLAAHETHWYDRAAAPLVAFSNLIVAAWLYPSWRTARISWNPDRESLVLAVKRQSKPIIYYSWHEYELVAICAFKDHYSDSLPKPVGHDGVVSRMLQHATTYFGYSVFVYWRHSSIHARDQLTEFVKKDSSEFGFFVDSGGPYGQVKAGMVEVARQSEALLIPFAVQSRPAIKLGRRGKLTFPFPFSSMVIFWGQPMDGKSVTVAKCQKALEIQVERSKG